MVFSLPKIETRHFGPPTSAEAPQPARAVIGDQAAADLREAARLEALARYEVLDSPKEEAFDRITRLAKKVFDVPMVLVTFIDNHRAWTKSSDGIEVTEARRCHSLCSHTILQSKPLVIADAQLDPRFALNPHVAGKPHLRFYAGVPLTTPDGFNLGALCAVDMVPREFSESQIEMLEDLGKMVMSELELRKLAITDGLTGALSRRGFNEQARKAVLLAVRHHQNLSCIAFDLDHFKKVNDAFGHARGDDVLMAAVDQCFKNVRDSDIVGRLGGEEFAVILPHTSIDDAREVAEKLRAAIAAINVLPVDITASFGMAALSSNCLDLDSLLSDADAALYAAKAAGRNRVVDWTEHQKPRTPDGTRVFKAGQINFNGGTSSMDCTVRRLSEQGANLQIFSSVGIPRTFDLTIAVDNFRKRARIVSQSEKHVDVEFVADAE